MEKQEIAQHLGGTVGNFAFRDKTPGVLFMRVESKSLTKKKHPVVLCSQFLHRELLGTDVYCTKK